MGSPVSPIIANLYMEHLEDTAISSAPVSCKPRLWKRYVDDILEIVKKDAVEQLTSHLNQADETGNIKFTCEIEKDGAIPFLDTKLTRLPNKQIKFTVYRKPTHTNQYLHFESHHPLHQKLGVVNTLLHRCEVVVTDPKDKEEEKKTVKTALAKCGYPPWTLKERKKKEEEKESQSKKDKHEVGPKKLPVTIPYVKGLSEAVKRVMGKRGVSVAMKPQNKLRNILVHPKDKIEELDKGQGVYRVPCKSCTSSYIGETSRRLSIRIEEHKKDCEKKDQVHTRAQRASLSQQMNKSAITDHVIKEKHVIDWEGVRIVAREDQDMARRIREAIWIKRTPDNMNRDGGAYQLSGAYDAVIARSSSGDIHPLVGANRH